MEFLDFFAGIGGFRTGLEMAGHKCVGFAEIDKYARQSYKAIHNTIGESEWHDITKVSDDDFRLFRGRVQLIAGGFPCQAFSVAGKRGGFDDTRGTLFFEIARAAKQIEPRYLLLENVKGLLSHDKGNTFATIIATLDELGYVGEWGVLNSKYWGVPQNRERIFILAEHKRYRSTAKKRLFHLMQQQTSVDVKLRDILEQDVDEKYYLSEEKTSKLVLELPLKEEYHQNGDVHPFSKTIEFNGFKSSISPCLLATDFKAPKTVLLVKENTKTGFTKAEEGDGVDLAYENSKTRRGRVVKGLAHTLTAKGEQANVVEGINVVGSLNTGYRQNDEVLSIDGVCSTLQTMQGGNREPKILSVLTPDRLEKRQNGRRFKDNDEPSFTLTAQDIHGVMYNRNEGITKALDCALTLNASDYRGLNRNQSQTAVLEKFRIRKLTPRECWRLQGFTDQQFDKAVAAGVSNSQLYKQAGNSVTVNVIYEIAKTLDVEE